MEYFYICGIPFKFLFFKKGQACCQVGESHQKIYISGKYFNDDGTVKDEKDLVWIFNREDVMKRIKCALDEETGVSTYNKNRR